MTEATENDVKDAVKKLGDVKAPENLSAEIMSRVRVDRSFLGLGVRGWKYVGIILFAFAVVLQLLFWFGPL